MKLFDIFKKKKEKPEEKKPPEARPRTIKAKKKVSRIACRVLASPHITEKSTDLGEKNKYVFKVFSEANKIEIKKAIEDLYGVEVVDVRIINIPRKRKRAGGRREGWRKGYKKAIIKIKEGQKIEIMPR